MKKNIFLLIITVLLPLIANANGELAVYENAYIWGQSARNSSKKGSAIDLTSGKTYSLSNSLTKTTPDHIDMMCFWGKIGSEEKNFYFFAPGSAGKIDWTHKIGTLPYCEMIGSLSTDSAGLTSLKSWNLRNITKLMVIKSSTTNFDNATYESISALKIPENSYIVNNLNVGDVIAFELASTSVNPGKKGLIKIVSIEDDPEKPENAGKGANQKINIVIKVQK